MAPETITTVAVVGAGTMGRGIAEVCARVSKLHDMQITTNAGAWVEHTFTGNAVRWIGRKFDDAGQCDVAIDGSKVATVDQYDPVRDTPFRYEVRDLSPGRHTIRLTLLEQRNPASKHRYANITGFDVLHTSPVGSPETRRP